MSFVIFLSCLAGFIIPHLVFSSNQSVSFHLHNLEFQQIDAVSLASFFYSRKIQLPSNYMNELSFHSLSLVSLFPVWHYILSRQWDHSYFVIKECNDKEAENQRWDERDHIQFERNGIGVFFSNEQLKLASTITFHRPYSVFHCFRHVVEQMLLLQTISTLIASRHRSKWKNYSETRANKGDLSVTKHWSKT